MRKRRHSRQLSLCLLVAAPFLLGADLSAQVKIRPLRERAQIQADLNIKRVDRLLLPAMRKAGIDCWVIMSREFNEDFVLDYIMDVKGDTGGHRNAYLFFDDGTSRLQRIAIGTHLPRTSQVWDKIISYHNEPGVRGPSLRTGLKRIIAEWNPKKIGLNQSRTIPFCDGLTVEMKKFLIGAIGREYEKRFVSAESMIVDFLDTRLAEELDYFQEACAITNMIHEEVLSRKAVTPGKTTLSDLRWYIYNRLAELDLETWYVPILVVTCQGREYADDSTVIQPGDLVHSDIGIKYIGLYTDYQKNAYVLRPDESAAPAGFEAALQNSLKVQDAVFQVARAGKIGYKIKEEAESLAKTWRTKANVYSHSVGLGGHGIGAWINPNWPDRYGVRATFPLRLGAFYSIESSAITEIPEWGNRKFSLGTEEDAWLAEDGLRYFYPRQEKLFLI